MSGREALSFLKELCQRIDMQSVACAAATVALPTMLVACEEAVPLYGVPEYGAPFEEVECANGLDDDSDGQIDCQDQDCAALELCIGCSDGIDNNGDDAADCTDQSCTNAEACVGDCDDQQDDDGDGHTDCDDPDCAGSQACP